MALSLKAIWALCEAEVSLVFEASSSDRVRDLRGRAVRWTQSYFARLYEKYSPDFLDLFVEKKFALAKSVNSADDFVKLQKCSVPRQGNGEYTAGSNFSIPEEELIFWSELSLMIPLHGAKYERFQKLFIEVGLADLFPGVFSN